MLLPSKDGIICTYCGAEARGDFTYYSLDFREVVVTNCIRRVGDITISADLCEDCISQYRERIKAAYRPPVQGKFSCDISGEVVDCRNLTYYQCSISRVAVSFQNSNYICTGCGKARRPKDGQCCVGRNLERKGDVTVDDKYLEVNFSKTMYLKFVEHINSIRS